MCIKISYDIRVEWPSGEESKIFFSELIGDSKRPYDKTAAETLGRIIKFLDTEFDDGISPHVLIEKAFSWHDVYLAIAMIDDTITETDLDRVVSIDFDILDSFATERRGDNDERTQEQIENERYKAWSLAKRLAKLDDAVIKIDPEAKAKLKQWEDDYMGELVARYKKYDQEKANG